MIEYDAYSDGIKCFHAGYTKGMNPNAPGSFNAIAWLSGWVIAQADSKPAKRHPDSCGCRACDVARNQGIFPARGL